MARLSVAALLVALGACDRGAASRLYTDDELAELEAKARPHATRDPDSILEDSTLSLHGIRETLDAIDKNPDLPAAAQETLDQIPLVRTIGTGRDSLARLFVVHGGERMVADALDNLLDRAAVSLVELDLLADEVDHDLATEIQIADAFAGDWRWLRGTLLYRTFTPSGGNHDQRDERALTLAMIDELEAQVTAACPAGSTLESCHRRLPKSAGPLELAGGLLDRAQDKIRNVNEVDRQQLQADLVREVVANQMGAYRFYVERAGAAVSRLVALRIHIEILRKNSCDVAATIAAPAVLGDHVTITKGDRTVGVSPPVWAQTTHPPEHWTLPCP